MSSWTSPRTWVAGILTSAGLNEIRDNLNYIKDVIDLHGMTSSSSRAAVKTRRYGCRVTNSTDIAIPDSTDKFLTWDTDDVDSTPGLHSETTATARITIPSGGDGDWHFAACLRFATNTTGSRQAYFEKNPTGGAGTGVNYGHESRNGVTGTQTYISMYADIPNLTAGDFVTVTVKQTSGSSLDVTLSGASGQCFSGYRLSST